MGNDTSKKTQHDEDNSEAIPHQKFSSVKHIESSNLLEITLPVESETDLNRWVDDLKKTSGFDKESLLLEMKHQFSSRGFCGSSGILKIYFQNYPYVFQQEVDNRISKKNHFDEEQLWYLLYSLVSAAKDFSRINKKVGDIRPYNIFINEEGHIKIANVFSWPYEKPNFEKTAYEKIKTFLSPEEMALISRGCMENKTDPILSESFSIGLTLLQAGMLYNFENIYSPKHGEMDLAVLQQKLQEWMNPNKKFGEHQYSPTLKNIVKNMLQTDPQKRESSLEVQNILRPYAESILHLIPFNYNEVSTPQNKIQQIKTYQGAPQNGAIRPQGYMIPGNQPQFILNETPKLIGESPHISEVVSQFEPKKPGWDAINQKTVVNQPPVVIRHQYAPIQPQFNTIQQQYAPPQQYNPVHQQFNPNQFSSNPPAGLPNNFAYSNAVPYIAGKPLGNASFQPLNNPISYQDSAKPIFAFQGSDNHQDIFQKYSTTQTNLTTITQTNLTTTQPQTKFDQIDYSAPQNPFQKQKNVEPSQTYVPPQTKPLDPPISSGLTTNTTTFTSTSYQSSIPPQVTTSLYVPKSDYSSASDILKKIDEQLNASRKQFPSS